MYFEKLWWLSIRYHMCTITCIPLAMSIRYHMCTITCIPLAMSTVTASSTPGVHGSTTDTLTGTGVPVVLCVL